MASDGPRPTTVLGMTIARHRIERLIGGGAMGRVFVCRTPDDHVVAVKLLRTSHAALGDRLLDKRGVLEKVRSPHVVEVYDVSVYNNVPYLVMELCEGSTLAALLKSGPLRTADALAAGSMFAYAVERYGVSRPDALREAGSLYADMAGAARRRERVPRPSTPPPAPAPTDGSAAP